MQPTPNQEASPLLLQGLLRWEAREVANRVPGIQTIQRPGVPCVPGLRPPPCYPLQPCGQPQAENSACSGAHLGSCGPSPGTPWIRNHPAGMTKTTSAGQRDWPPMPGFGPQLSHSYLGECAPLCKTGVHHNTSPLPGRTGGPHEDL